MRILYIQGSIDPLTGGPAQSAPNIWLAVRRAGVEVTVAGIVDPANPDEGQMLRRLRAEGVEVRTFAYSRIRQFRRWGVSLPLALSLAWRVRAFDIVHAHGAWTVSSLTALVAARLWRKPFVLTPHESLTDGDVGKGTSALRSRVKRIVRTVYANLADAIIFASTTEAEASLAPGRPAKIEVLYHPLVEDPATLPAARAAGAPHPLRVGYLGRFDTKKNLELLIDAVAGLPQATLCVAGGGDDRYAARLRQLAQEKGVSDRTRWLGFIPGAERPAFFAGIDVLVMPSVFEGFGMVAAEAMCQAVPVIVSEQTGIAELVRRYECGLVVAADAAQVRAALAQLGSDAKRIHAFSERALEAVRNELTFASFGARLLRIYQGLRPERSVI